MLFTLISAAIAGSPTALSELVSLDTGYGAALSQVVHDPAWSDAELASLSLDADWRVAHQARVVLAWRADSVRAADHWDMPPMQARAQGLLRYPGGAEAWDMVFLDRLLHADETPEQQAALIEVCLRSDFDESEAFYAMLVDAPSPIVRESLVFALLTSDLGVDAIRLGLVDADPTVRMVAARGAARRDDGAVLQPDLVRALKDSDGQVRAAAARSLGVLTITAAGPSLVPLLTDADPEVRLTALRALDRLGAAGPHANGMLADSDDKVQRLALKITSR